ncbi:MAG: D-glycerate dehydrogenase, partial [Undibacterium sp.]|nr:D-glycerate dehydrogenase [Opitutaceae bacterium]
MNPRPLIAVSRRYDSALLRELAATAEIMMPPDEAGTLSRETLLGVAGRLVALITQGDVTVDAALIVASPNLRIVANAAIGVNNLALDELRRRSIWATNAPEGFVEATADCAIGLLLMLARRLGEADRFVRAGNWTAFEPGRWDGTLLRGKTLGLIGYGRIGRAVERRADAFGLTVIHHTRTRTAAPQWRTLEALLAGADVVSLHVPLNTESERLLDAGRLALMKPGAW